MRARRRRAPRAQDALAGLDTIQLDAAPVDCVLGMNPEERHTPQRLLLRLTLYLDARRSAGSGRLLHTVDYSRLAGEVRFLLQACHFRLLETAAHALCSYAAAPPTQDSPRVAVRAAAVRLTKTVALPGGVGPDAAAQATCSVLRLAGQAIPRQEQARFGRVDTIHVSRDCGIYRLRIAPGGRIPCHEHREMEEHELVLGRGLLLQGQPVAPGSGYSWPPGLPHRYDNPCSQERTVLCVDRPRFIPADEVVVPEPPGGLRLPAAVEYYDRPRGPGGRP